MINYHKMLKSVSTRMLFIKTTSLENETLNDEWNELFKVQNGLIKLIKIQDKLIEETK